MKKIIIVIIIVLSILIGVGYYFVNYTNLFNNVLKEETVENKSDSIIEQLNKDIRNLNIEIKILNNAISIYKNGFNNIKENKSEENINVNFNHMESELERLKKEQGLFVSKALPLSEIKDKLMDSNYLFDVKTEKSIKFSIMEVGRWNLNRYEIEDIEKTFSKEKAIYEIIPIVDNKKYINDANELKQLGISRKRAAVAVEILKELNVENKVFISDSIITSETERGFVINRINFKTK